MPNHNEVYIHVGGRKDTFGMPQSQMVLAEACTPIDLSDEVMNLTQTCIRGPLNFITNLQLQRQSAQVIHPTTMGATYTYPLKIRVKQEKEKDIEMNVVKIMKMMITIKKMKIMITGKKNEDDDNFEIEKNKF